MALILKNNCSLIIQGEKGYIKSSKYLLPISPKVGIFLSLLNGERELPELIEIISDIGLCNTNLAESFCKRIIARYSTLLQENIKNEINNNKHYNPQDFAKIVYPSYDPLYPKYPEALLFIVTNNCDKACAYCYMDAQRSHSIEADSLSYKELLNILDDAATMGISSLALSGGEPFLRNDLIDIITYANNLGMHVNATTKFNLTFEQVKKLSKLENFELFLSYDCHIDEIASYLVGEKNYALKKDALIKDLIDKNIKFTVCPVVTNISFNYIKDFLLHLEKLGVKNIDFSRYLDTFGRNNEKFLLNDKQWDEISNIYKLFPNLNITVQANLNDFKEPNNLGSRDNICLSGRISVVILHNGKTVLCEKVSSPLDFCYGDLRKDSLNDIWNSDTRKKFIFPSREDFKNTICFDCKKFDKCLKKRRCIKRALIESNTINTPINSVKDSCKVYMEGSNG